MNICQKLVAAGIGAVFGVSAISVSSQAASFSFSEEYSNTYTGTSLLSGTFTGEDLNNDLLIDLDELSDFSLTYESTFGTFNQTLTDLGAFTYYLQWNIIGFYSSNEDFTITRPIQYGVVFGGGVPEFGGTSNGPLAATLVEDPPTSVPEPSLILALGAIAVGGLLQRKVKC
ncbi:MAG: PEP-CTERM sorting domain-containing protein [Oscillatoria sp. PMC 1076.18]|nr:PEP-CTERM sorting domain-containing protein [Oscillatoria sp. PMC 1076.18]